MKRKTAELFFMIYMKTVNTENARGFIIVLLTDTDEKIWAKKLCNTVNFMQSVNFSA